MVSPYLNLATDGTDPGVNFSLAQTQIDVARTGDRRGVTRTLYTGTFEGASYPVAYCTLTYPTTTGTVWNVSSAAALQNALTNSNPGDDIVIAAGTANRIVGNFTLPVKATADATPGGNGVVTIRSASLSSLPEGVRVFGADAAAHLGIAATNVAYFAHIRSADNVTPVFQTAAGAKGYRLAGLYIDQDPAVTVGPSGYYPRFVSIGDGDVSVQTTSAQVPSNIILDRCIVTGHDTLHTRIGVANHGRKSGLLDSCVEKIHTYNTGDCQAYVGWNGLEQRFAINCSLSASSEPIAEGGANNAISEQSDTEWRWIHVFKPLTWKTDDASYAGIPWEIKNNGEIKKANRLLFEGIYARQSWAAAQYGYQFLIKNEYVTANTSHTKDVIVRYADLSKSAIGIAVMGGTDPNDAFQIQRCVLSHVLVDECGTTQWDSTSSYGMAFRVASTADCKIVHCTAWGQREYVELLQGGASDGANSNRLVVRDSIFFPTSFSSFRGAGTSGGQVSMDTYAPGGSIHGCVLISDSSAAYTETAYTGNYFPATAAATGFTDTASRSYWLQGTTQTPATSVATPSVLAPASFRFAASRHL